MEENNVSPTRRPRRRRRTKAQIIKEAYLPYLILMAAALLIIIFIIGALVRNGAESKNADADAPRAAVCQTEVV